MQEQPKTGDIVSAHYKTGSYIGEIQEWQPAKAAVKVLAVLKHPDQGNLHHPMAVEVAIFHQRRALAFGEIAWMPAETVSPYRGSVPNYMDSLREALDRDIGFLRKTAAFAERALRELEELEKDYFKKV